VAETKTKPTGASVDEYLASRASPEKAGILLAAEGLAPTRAAVEHGVTSWVPQAWRRK